MSQLALAIGCGGYAGHHGKAIFKPPPTHPSTHHPSPSSTCPPQTWETWACPGFPGLPGRFRPETWACPGFPGLEGFRGSLRGGGIAPESLQTWETWACPGFRPKTTWQTWETWAGPGLPRSGGIPGRSPPPPEAWFLWFLWSGSGEVRKPRIHLKNWF